MIKILVLIDSLTELSRRFLKGLIRYSFENGPWIFYRIPANYKTLYGEALILQRIKEWEIDAVIVQWESEDVGFLEKLKIPVFFQSYRDKNMPYSKISGNYQESGVMAAKFFAKKRFQNFAYYGQKDLYWSKARAEGFAQEVEKIGGNYYYFESEMLFGSEWKPIHDLLNNWVISLPKPVALFACDDNFAIQILKTCYNNNINIPNELALLGVGNDDVICNLAYPSISSIVTEDENGGYDTGKMLHRLISAKKNTLFNIEIRPIRIVSRQSTEKYNISDKYILKIVNYIIENITSNLSINDLLKIVPLSRRNLDLKFRKTMGQTIYQFIQDNKIEYISDMLLTTHKNLLDISEEIGFNDVRNLYRIFKKHTGYTPIDFRKKYCQNDN